MASNNFDDLTKEGKVFIDELNKIRLANPDLFESSNLLKNESEQFIEQLNNFKNLVNSVRSTLEEIGKISDAERLKAMAAENEARKTIQGENSEESQQIQILIREKQTELERLKVELQSLKSVEAQQIECLQKLRSSTL